MPVARYSLYVGGALLALLFAIGCSRRVSRWSEQWRDRGRAAGRGITFRAECPERVVYDTSLPIIVPATSNMQIAAPQPPALSAQSRVRNTFAQFGPESGQAAPESKQIAGAAAQKPKFRRRRSAKSPGPIRIRLLMHRCGLAGSSRRCG